MNEHIDPYSRLQQYFFAIKRFCISSSRSDEEYRIPLKYIADSANVPMEIFRADIVCFFEVLFDDFGLVHNNEDILEKYETRTGFNWISFRADMAVGIYDDAELEMYSFDEDKVFLPLSREESTIMEQVLHEHYNRKGDRNSPFLVKDSYHFNFLDEKSINKTLFNIHYAIEGRNEVKIKDYSTKGRPERVVKPVRLFYDTTENLYAFICLKENGLCAFRIDKIGFLGEGERFDPPEDLENRLSVIPNVWGLDFSAKPMKVRVRIFASHGRGNVGKLAKKDLECRVNGRLYEDGECLVYEDTVYGKDAFLRWLFGYGSSVVLEKPVSLRKEILSIVKKELYGM